MLLFTSPARVFAVPRSARLALALSLTTSVGVWGCGSNASGVSRTNPTYVEIAPEEFTGGVSCSGRPGGFRWYVATLIDVTEAADFRLPSSPPTPCSQSVFFSGVTSGREYVAELEGYDEAELDPKHEGSWVMLDGDDVATPRWIGGCGMRRSKLLDLIPLPADAGASEDAPSDAGFLEQFLGAVSPRNGRTVRLRGCSLREVDGAPSSLGRVSVRLDDALGGLECGDAPGQVLRFEVTHGGRTETAECDGAALIDELPTGSLLRFDVTAFEAVEEALDAGAESASAPERIPSTGQTWVTQCYQTPAAGVELHARCDPLRPTP